MRSGQHAPCERTRAGDTTMKSNAADSAIATWAQLVYVQEGLISPEEAGFLMDFLFKHLAPFSPILLDEQFWSDSDVRELKNEPLLVTTVLMLAARFVHPPGWRGSLRSIMVHDRLFTRVQTMINSLF